jgi:hypothetical protein
LVLIQLVHYASGPVGYLLVKFDVLSRIKINSHSLRIEFGRSLLVEMSHEVKLSFPYLKQFTSWGHIQLLLHVLNHFLLSNNLGVNVSRHLLIILA